MKTLCSALIAFIIYLSVAGNVLASNFFLSRENTNISSGSTTSLDVMIDTKGESVNGISAFLSYPKDILDVAWITYDDAFPIQAEEFFGDGLIKISRGSYIGEAGNAVAIATIGFTAKSEGNAVVSFVTESAAPRTSDSSDSLNLSESTGAAFTVGQVETQSNPYFCFLLECIL